MTASGDHDPASIELMDSLVQASFTVMAQLSQAAAAHDLSLTQLRALAILRDRKPKMAELATYLGLDRSSVSGLIDRAARRGLVRRDTSSKDGRGPRQPHPGRASPRPRDDRRIRQLHHPSDQWPQRGREEATAWAAAQTVCLNPRGGRRAASLADILGPWGPIRSTTR